MSHPNDTWLNKCFGIIGRHFFSQYQVVNFQCRGVLPIWLIVGQGPTALAVGAGGGCLEIFTLIYFSLLFLSLFGRRYDIDRNIVSKDR